MGSAFPGTGLQEEDDDEEFELGTEQEEQETAWATNFSAVAIVEEEEDLVPLEANELKYVNVSPPACRLGRHESSSH